MNEMIQTKDLCFEYQGEEQNTQVLKQMNPVSYTHLDVYKRQD